MQMTKLQRYGMAQGLMMAVCLISYNFRRLLCNTIREAVWTYWIDIFSHFSICMLHQTFLFDRNFTVVYTWYGNARQRVFPLGYYADDGRHQILRDFLFC